MRLTDGDEARKAEVRSRYEFRIWAADLSQVFARLREFAELEEIQEMSDTYIVSKAVTTFSTKLRGNRVEIKQLMERRPPLERWRPFLKLDFPVSGGRLRGEVIPALGLTPERLNGDGYDAATFLRSVVSPKEGLEAVSLQKTRHIFSLDLCRAEYTGVGIGDYEVETFAIESEKVPAALRLITRLGLRSHENLDYQQALRRLLGMGLIEPDR